MEKIHIALVGGQVTPVFLGIRHVAPDKVFYICSKETIDEAKRVAGQFADKIHNFVIFNPTDLQSIFESMNLLKNEIFSKAESKISLTINITSGTKLWSLVCFDLFSHQDNTTLFYIDQNNILTNFRTGEIEEVEFLKSNSDIDITFAINGFDKVAHKVFSSYSADDLKNANTIKQLRQEYSNAFGDLTKEMSKKENRGSMRIVSKNSSFSYFSAENRMNVKLEKNGKIHEVDLVSSHIKDIVFQTDWFVLWCANQFVKKGFIAGDNIWISSKFQKNTNQDLNEIDIIMNTGHKLLFVECKTQIKNINDIDKFTAAYKNYGGIGTKALLITEAKLNKRAEDKVKVNGIMQYSLFENQGGIDNLIKSLIDELKKSAIR
jgi:hypothetical protein